MSASLAVISPPEFRAALAEFAAVALRPEMELSELPAPARLAPWSHAVAVTVRRDMRPMADPDDTESASGRFILLHDPEGVDAWEGSLRVVVFATAEVESDLARDPLLPEVAWSWLGESLAASGATAIALGGTVTATSSTRFGDISGPKRTDDLEIRASWTPTDGHLGAHLQAFAGLLALAGGLPPEGVASLWATDPTNVR